MNSLSHLARTICTQALAQLDVGKAVRDAFSLTEDTVTVAGATLAFSQIDEVFILAAGKAAIPMYSAARDALAPVANVRIQALVVGPPQSTAPSDGTEFIAAGHPTPNESSLRAAEAALTLLRQATHRTLVLFLISGGASSLLEKPVDSTILPSEMATLHRLLVESGLPIAEMNILRKHLSAVKGGRLAQAAFGARQQITMLVSDVDPTTPEVVGSGPSLPDESTLDDCQALLRNLQPFHQIPASILSFVASPLSPETPKPGGPLFARAAWQTVMSSDHLAAAARAAAEVHGFHVEIDNTCDDWDYQQAGRYLLHRSRELTARYGPTCLISVGEVSVPLPAQHGTGGRNGHFALWCADEAARTGQQVTILSAATDGVDGNSRSAGAVCDWSTTELARVAGMSVEAALTSFNTAPLLAAIGATLPGGATGQNVRDLRLILTL